MLRSQSRRSFADDTNLTFSAVDLSVLQTEMSNDLNRIFDWFCSNKLTLNILKTDFMVLSSLQRIATLDENISLRVNGLTLQQVETTKYLGLTIDQFLTWKNHFIYQLFWTQAYPEEKRTNGTQVPKC